MKILKIVMAIATMLFMSNTVLAQNQETAYAYAEAVVPLMLNKGTNDLAFGALQPDPLAAATLTISAAETPTVTKGGGSNLIVYNFKPQTAAEFDLTGSPFGGFIITHPSTATLTNTDSGNSETMTVDNFTSNATYSFNTLDFIKNDGTYKIYIGGTLNIGAAQAVGSYTGTFEVTVNYF
ncbi:uncharacterized protein DUF4402 [Jejuia pallidilutea]|uniref:Uncharacterized protein DUF4402 n=1 Tax=Jejuia pallidilutea TaxID=504487 RepID=A0A362X0T4_9FLAO|nr:DUF4402 domain-containing protein [Jejuia pallidilutea]PQV49471.1 uncharacterized protein DUF4402 [Jejuia pallidilutea]